MKWWVNPRHGCIDKLLIDQEIGSLAELFGFNEYAEWDINKKRIHHKQTEPKRLSIKKKEDSIFVEGIIGAQKFSTMYLKTREGLLMTIDREYLDDVDVFDDSVCFISPRVWYKRFRLYTPSNNYYRWWERDAYTSLSPVESDWDPLKPREGQNLFAEAKKGGWGEILGSKGGLRFEILDFSGGNRPQHHIVEFPRRKHVEFEFTFDIHVTERRKGDRQMLKLIINEVVL